MEGGGLGLGYVDWQEEEDKMMSSKQGLIRILPEGIFLLLILPQASMYNLYPVHQGLLIIDVLP